MSSIASKKIHFAPLSRQAREIRRALRAGKHRNVTELMRAAIDSYLERPDQASLRRQAERMAVESTKSRDHEPIERLQDASRKTTERW